MTYLPGQRVELRYGLGVGGEIVEVSPPVAVVAWDSGRTHTVSLDVLAPEGEYCPECMTVDCPLRVTMEACVCGGHAHCPDGYHSMDESPCICTPDCALCPCGAGREDDDEQHSGPDCPASPDYQPPKPIENIHTSYV